VKPSLTPVPLPCTQGNRWAIVWPRIGEPLSLVSLSSHVVGLYAHWMDGRSHPCLLPAGCPGCESDRKVGRRKHWAGYLCSWSPKDHERVVLMLPKRTVEKSLTLRDTAIDLRGASVEAYRIGKETAGPVGVNIRLAAHAVPADSEEPDTIAVLEGIWRVMFPEIFGGIPLEGQT